MVRLESTMPADVVRVDTPHGQMFLDLRVTPELQAEAYAREIIRRVQQMRKEVDLEVDDYIVTVVKTKKEFAAMLERQTPLIARETHSRTLTFADKPFESEYTKEWRGVGGHPLTIWLTPPPISRGPRAFPRVPCISPPQATAPLPARYHSG